MAESSISRYNDSSLCKICSKAKGKYVCPRCNILYCSVSCYQSEQHISCSEAFYRDCVMEDMKTNEFDPGAEKSMYGILRRLQETEDTDANLDSDDDDENIPDLHERLRNVNLDDADSVWEKLTLAEKKEFEELLQSGDASDFVVPWTPWWLYRKQKQLVQEVESEEIQSNYEASCPPVKRNIPPFTQLSKTDPSPCVKFNILNVLAAYCYTTRFFNGEHHSIPSETSNILINLAANLSLNHTYDSAATAIESVAHEAVNCTWLGGSPESITCMKEDVDSILAGPEESNCKFYLQAALSDIHKLLTEAKNEKLAKSSEEKKPGEFTKKYSENSKASVVPKEKLRVYIKKLEYYLSWSQDYYKDICYQDAPI